MIYDISPIPLRKFVFCAALTLCDAQNMKYTENIEGIAIQPDVSETTNLQMSIRFNNSKDTVDYIIIIYGDTFIDASLNIDPLDKINFDRINHTIWISSQNDIASVDILTLTTRKNHALNWVLDAATLRSNRSWKIPNIRMINGGRFLSSVGVEAENITIDSQNIDVLSNMKYLNLTIYLIVGSLPTMIVISENSIMIGFKIAENVPNDANVTICVTQEDSTIPTENDMIVMLYPEMNLNPKNIRFIVNEKNQNKVIFDFAQGIPGTEWDKVTNEPFIEILSKNNSKAEIKNLVHPIKMIYRNISSVNDLYEKEVGNIKENIGTEEYQIYEEFPMNSTKIGICLSNNNSYCNQFSRPFIEERDSIYKKIDTNEELVSIFKTFLTVSNIQKLTISIQPNTIIDLNFSSFDFIPQNIRFEGSKTSTVNILVSYNYEEILENEELENILNINSISISSCDS